MDDRLAACEEMARQLALGAQALCQMVQIAKPSDLPELREAARDLEASAQDVVRAVDVSRAYRN